MRDFRIIQRFEREWKDDEQKMSSARSEIGFEGGATSGPTAGRGGGLGLEDALNKYLEDMGEDGYF